MKRDSHRIQTILDGSTWSGGILSTIAGWLSAVSFAIDKLGFVLLSVNINLNDAGGGGFD